MSSPKVFPSQPEHFLEVRVKDLAEDPSITGLCVGYERSQWRAAPFADHIMEWLPEFVLNYSELRGVQPGNMTQLMREAAQRVGEFRKAAGALGVIGFSQSVEWADSAVFVLALLLHIQTMEIFQKPQSLGRTLIRHLVEDLRQGTYKSLAETLGLEVAWDNS